ncbi:hypothetical protein PIB30_097112 [Stylosanthes scabra]|uniref:Pentatricopeptide repeat-containing protein n=1 Tax=Stylosanthes scabra TaxID=79078 RepID=A0ABU6SX31_9FABA|nr:hypothetical protein [Stylosanthes scabra]
MDYANQGEYHVYKIFLMKCMKGVILTRYAKSNILMYQLLYFGKSLTKGCHPDAYMCSILLNGLCKCGRLRSAREFFEHLLVNNYCLDVVTYNIMISGLAKEGLIDEAVALFSKMKGNGCLPNAVSYETIIRALLARNKNEQAVKLLHEMISEGLLTNNSNKDSKFMRWDRFLNGKPAPPTRQKECQLICKIHNNHG